MSEKSGIKRDNCDFSCTERMCETLDRAGVPPDTKWRTLILYMRNLDQFESLTDQQKGQIQGLIVETLKRKDFSDQAYREIVKNQEEIINRPCQSKLSAAIEETAGLVKEFRKLLLERTGDVQGLEGATIEAVQSGKDPDEVIADLKVAFKDVVDLMKSDSERLIAMSYTDALTSLNNRRALDDFMEKRIAEWLADKRPLSLLMLDIDHFKKFNDTYGHRIGDQALKWVASLIKAMAEQLALTDSVTCFAARYGGEEFAVVLPGVELAQAREMAEDFREKVEKNNLILKDAQGKVLHKGIRITVSVGAAMMDPAWQGSLAENLIDSADKALYMAKAEGRNRVCHFDPSQNAAGC